MKASKTDLIGKVFGKYTVVEFAYIKNHKSYWKCIDKSGNYNIISRNNLVSKYSNPKVDTMIGKRFGKLVVLSLNNDKGEKVYHCKCDCGNECDKVGWRLRNGSVKSCGHCNHVGEEHNGVKIIGQISKGQVICKCPYCGKEFQALYNLITSGRVKSCGCQSKSYKDLAGMRFGKLIVMYDTGKTYDGNHIWHCKCDCGNEKDIRSKNLINGETHSCGCITTNFSGSSCENEIKDYIAILIDDKPAKVKILDGKEIDLYYDKYKFGIEYNGSDFHATIGGVYVNKSKDYHYNKFKMAKEKGIHLVTIFDVDWDRNKEKIKEYLKNIFMNKEKVYARKCVVKEIDKYLAVEFCNKYHLQGSSISAKIFIGLFYNDELLSVMSFGRCRNNKDSDTKYELVRYCVKSGYNIVGGANKLLKYFEVTYKPKEIISYSNNDYFTGNIYNKLGFKYAGQCSLPYYWYLHGKELKRQQCMPMKLKKLYPDLYEKAGNSKENYIMSSIGASKVYRCGNTKWIKKEGY